MAAPLAAPDNALENTDPAVDPNAEPTRVFAHWLTAWPAILIIPAFPSCCQHRSGASKTARSSVSAAPRPVLQTGEIPLQLGGLPADPAAFIPEHPQLLLQVLVLLRRLLQIGAVDLTGVFRIGPLGLLHGPPGGVCAGTQLRLLPDQFILPGTQIPEAVDHLLCLLRKGRVLLAIFRTPAVYWSRNDTTMEASGIRSHFLLTRLGIRMVFGFGPFGPCRWLAS